MCALCVSFWPREGERFANGVKFNVQLPVAVAAVIADGLALASLPEASNKCSTTA